MQGLIAGAPVWLAGRPVGRVESVSFGERPEGRSALRVVLQVDREVRERIRSDSVATIGTIGLLGDRYVEVSIGTSAGQPLEDGAEIPTITPSRRGIRGGEGHAGARQHRHARRQSEPVIEAFAKQGGGESLAGSVDALRARSSRRSRTATGCSTA